MRSDGIWKAGSPGIAGHAKFRQPKRLCDGAQAGRQEQEPLSPTGMFTVQTTPAAE